MSTIPKIKYKDWFINLKYVPDDTDEEESEAFWEKQRELCTRGCYIEDVYFSGFLYWHLNFWNTEIDVLDEDGRIIQKYTQPYFRDNEWIIANALEEANKQKKGLAIGGSRRISKSSFISSYMAHGATLDAHSQNLFVGINGDDIKVTTNKISKGLDSLPDGLRWMRVAEDWKKQVTLGIKMSNGQKVPFSEIIIRNLDNGNNEEAIAGTKPRRLVIEEAAKGKFLKGLQAAIPGFTTPHGWGCSPLAIFTGGDAKVFQDAKELFFNPEAYNFLALDDPSNPNRKMGLFLGNKYRQEGKVLTTFGDYLKIENKKSDLYNIPFWESDEKKAEEKLEEDLEKRLKGADRSAYFKEVMYFPKTPDDIFLNTQENMYSIKACQAQQVRIKEQGITGTPVELYHDGISVKWKTSLKDYITEWPIKNQNKDAPVIIYEMPVPDAPKFLYVAGIDSYIQDSSNTSDSLGTCYIFKRIHSLSGEGFQNTLVASYSARPDDQGDWEETVRLMLMFYNAYALVENDQPSFIKYMISKGSAEQYLAPEPKDLISSLIKKSNSSRRFGISRASKAVREHLNNVLKRYMEEVIHTTTHPETGEVLQETRGITRILDHTLLEELIGFSPIANCDRQVAASLAILMAQELDPLLGTAIGDQGNTRKKTLTQVLDNLPRKTFSGGGNPFSNKRKKSLFKK